MRSRMPLLCCQCCHLLPLWQMMESVLGVVGTLQTQNKKAISASNPKFPSKNKIQSSRMQTSKCLNVHLSWHTKFCWEYFSRNRQLVRPFFMPWGGAVLRAWARPATVGSRCFVGVITGKPLHFSVTTSTCYPFLLQLTAGMSQWKKREIRDKVCSKQSCFLASLPTESICVE